MQVQTPPPRRVALGIRIRPEIKEAAERAAAEESRSVSSWVELAIVQVLKGKKR
jgi:predicted HicB family RNase H-like nuclease